MAIAPPPGRNHPRRRVALALLLSPWLNPLALGPLLAPSPAAADPLLVEGPLQGVVRAGGEACRSALARRFNARADSVQVWVAPGLRIALEGGAGAAELGRGGLEFGWMLPERPAPAPIGLCRTSGEGRVLAIEQQPD